jgi:hypothetical protein
VAEYDKEIVNLAQHVLGQRQPKSELPPSEPKAEQRASELTLGARADRTDVPGGEETKTAAQLAPQIIEADLANHPDCPKNGFRVTVYAHFGGWC